MTPVTLLRRISQPRQVGIDELYGDWGWSR
jgi:hypothetical protein